MVRQFLKTSYSIFFFNVLSSMKTTQLYICLFSFSAQSQPLPFGYTEHIYLFCHWHNLKCCFNVVLLFVCYSFPHFFYAFHFIYCNLTTTNHTTMYFLVTPIEIIKSFNSCTVTADCVNVQYFSQLCVCQCGIAPSVTSNTAVCHQTTDVCVCAEWHGVLLQSTVVVTSLINGSKLPTHVYSEMSL